MKCCFPPCIPIFARVMAFAAIAMSGCSTLPSPAVALRADAMMRELADRNLFQGAVVIGRGGRMEYAAGFGFADLERQVPFTADTPNDGGSIAKTFTAAALLMLAGQGRVDLETRVREIVAIYPHRATRVRHLLSHSAGLPDFDWLDKRVPANETRTNTSHLGVVAREAPTPEFEPGSAFAYDNVAYDVAAMVIERVTGSSYADFVAAHFSRPLDLNAFVRPARFADWPGTRTRGYRRTASGWKDYDAHEWEGFHGASNIYISARDLYRWVAAYRGVVGVDAGRAAVMPARLDDGRATGITMGSWYVAGNGDRRYYTGHHNGFFNFGYADEARGLAVAWVANDAPPAWLQAALSRALIAIAESREPEPLQAPPFADSPANPSGTYRIADVGELVVMPATDAGGHLRVRLRGVEYEAFPTGRGVRYVPGLDAYLRFTSAPDGGVLLSWDSVYRVATAVARERVESTTGQAR